MATATSTTNSVSVPSSLSISSLQSGASKVTSPVPPHSYHLRYHGYSGTLARSLLALLSEAHCTDVQLSTGRETETIRAHRLILSAFSPYFKSLFNSLPSSQSYPVIIIRDISYETLCAIIEFCYRGKFHPLASGFVSSSTDLSSLSSQKGGDRSRCERISLLGAIAARANIELTQSQIVASVICPKIFWSIAKFPPAETKKF